MEEEKNPVGRPKKIKTPEIFWQLFLDYKKHTKKKSNLRTKVDYVGKFGEEKNTPLETPLTIEGFENYVADQGVINDLGDYFANSSRRYDEFATICTRVKRVIRQDQIEGGMVGQYNPSITQRINGLTDKIQIDKPEPRVFKLGD